MLDPKMTHNVDTEFRSLEYDGLESDGPFVILQTHEILLIFVVFQSAKFCYIGLRPSFSSSSESYRSVIPVRHFQVVYFQRPLSVTYSAFNHQ